MIAEFRPQAWINDYAVDVDPPGPTTWEVSPSYIESLPAGWRVAGTYERDMLRLDSAAPSWVQQWSGPFEVDVPELDLIPADG